MFYVNRINYFRVNRFSSIKIKKIKQSLIGTVKYTSILKIVKTNLPLFEDKWKTQKVWYLISVLKIISLLWWY